MIWMRWVLLAGALVKAFDAVDRGNTHVALLWVAAGAVLLWRERAGAVAVGLVAFGTVIAEVENASNHVIALGWVAFGTGLFTGAQRMLAWRATAATIYLFAGINKLLFGFLAGHVIAEGAAWLPAFTHAPLAIGGTLLELWLAAAVWRRWQSALPVAVLLHAGIFVWSDISTPANFLVAGMFQVLLVSLVVATVSRSRTAVRTTRPSSLSRSQVRA